MRARLELDKNISRRLKATLDDRQERARIVTPALEEIADDWLGIQRRRFGGSAQWKPLSPEWAVRKAQAGKSPMPLVGGELERSLTRRGARFAVRRVSQRQVVLGTSDPVANLHQGGTRRMPKRPPVSITRADERRWVDIISRHLSSSDVERGL
jgi:phage gpG-like protein